MSKDEEKKSTASDPEQPTVRFRQLFNAEDTVIALSEEGVVYRAETGFFGFYDAVIWRRLPTVTSTQLEMYPCDYPGCERLVEAIPGATVKVTRCTSHA